MKSIRSYYLAHCESFYKAYPAVRGFFSEKGALAALKTVSKLSTAILYAVYALGAFQAAYHLISDKGGAYRLILFYYAAPFLAFCATTAVRSGINAPRPYERYDLMPLIPKSTKGKSCPSRHTACAFAVAFAHMFSGLWGSYIIIPVIFLVIAAAVAVSRPLAGVHFPLDVVFGALIAVICFGMAYAVYLAGYPAAVIP